MVIAGLLAFIGILALGTSFQVAIAIALILACGFSAIFSDPHYSARELCRMGWSLISPYFRSKPFRRP